MKILIISHMYPSAFNEMSGIFVYQQARALVDNGCSVEVVSPVPFVPFPLGILSSKWKKYLSIPSSDVIGGIKVYYPRYLEFPRGILFHRSGYFMGRSLRKNLKSIYSDFKFDLIHSNVALPDGYAAVYANKDFNVPHVVTVHGQDFQNTIYRNEKCKKAVFGVLKNVDSIITVSSKLKNMVKSQDFYEKINIVNNGVNIDNISNIKESKLIKNNGKIKILSISNLIETKGIHINIEAVARLRSRYPDIQYDIIGDGEFKTSLQELVHKLKMEDNINFLGKMEHSKVIECIPDYDIFSLPSYKEGFGVAYVEAMSMGIPVIGIKGEGIEDAVQDGRNGFLVKRKDVEGLVKVLEKLIEDENLRSFIGNNGMITVKEHFTWNDNAKKVIKIYDELI